MLLCKKNYLKARTNKKIENKKCWSSPKKLLVEVD